MNSDTAAAINAWQALLGTQIVLVGNAAEAAFGQDTSGAVRTIPAALLISDADLLPDVVRIAQQFRVAVHPISTGRNWGYGSSLPPRDDCVILDLSGMKRITHFDPELGVVTIEPGVTQGMLAEFLDAHSPEFMVPVTGAGPTCSLMGNALERGYGLTPYTDHFSAVTDIEVVLADGSIHQTALRNVAGAELARLFKWGLGPYTTGIFSQSGLGIVTSMSILLARRPEAVRVCLFSLKDDELLEPSVAAIRSILSSLPGTVGGINLMNRHRVLAMTAPHPEASKLTDNGLIEPSEIHRLGRQYQVAPWTGFASLYGTRRVVQSAKHEIRHKLKGIGSRVLFLSPSQARLATTAAKLLPGALGSRLARTAGTLSSAMELLTGRPNSTALPLAYWKSGEWPSDSDAANPARDGCGLTWYAPLVPMRASSVRNFVDFATETTTRFGVEPLITLTSVSDRLFDSTIPVLFDRRLQRDRDRAAQCVNTLTEAGRIRGFHPYRLGIDAMQALPIEAFGPASLANRLKQCLDPNGLISPGRYQTSR